jgi:hypothetical protein
MEQLPPKWYMTQITKHCWYFIENCEGGCSIFHHKLTLCTLFCWVDVFQVTESDAVDVVETVLKDIRVSPDTVAFSLTALLKLSSRFSHCAE